jgi:hypothetical protein
MISCCDYQIWSTSPHPSPSSNQTWFPGKPPVDFNDFPIWNLHVVRGLPSEPCLIIQGKSIHIPLLPLLNHIRTISNYYDPLVI